MEKATYVSVWDDGIEVRSGCMFNKETYDVSDIEMVDLQGVDILIDEYIELSDGTQIRLEYDNTNNEFDY